MNINKKPLTKLQIFKTLKKISILGLSSEKINLYNAYGRISSSDIISKINIPPFNNSAVDGYALHKKDIKTIFWNLEHCRFLPIDFCIENQQPNQNEKLFI